MKNPTMLYKSPGAHSTDGVSYDYTIVDADEVEAKLAEGWSGHYLEAAERAKGADAAQLNANEQELAQVEQQLQAAGDLKAVHKGRGVWAVVDGAGHEVEGGLTKEQAHAKAGA